MPFSHVRHAWPGGRHHDETALQVSELAFEASRCADIDGAERVGSEFLQGIVRRLNGGQAPTARRPRKLEHPRGQQVAEGENGNVIVERTRRLCIAPDKPGDRNGTRRERLVGDVERFRPYLRRMLHNVGELGHPAPKSKDDQTVEM